MTRQKNARMQGTDILRKMYAKGIGTSKHADKLIYGGKPAPDKIYTNTTLKSYLDGWNRFCDYLETANLKSRNLSELEPHVQPFVGWLLGMSYSAHTIHTWVAAVCKVLGLPLANYVLPKRQRKDITRSRYPVKSDVHFAAHKHLDLITYCRCVGPRNKKELQQIRGTDLCQLPDGGYAVHIVKGKGGKERYAPVYGSATEVDLVVAMMQEAGEQLVFPHVHSAADIHSYRAEYACRVYKAHARSLEVIPRKEKYICRKDMAGTVYDKMAMKIASEALGHSRLDVIALSYLWALELYA